MLIFWKQEATVPELFKAFFNGGPSGVAAGSFTHYKIGGQVPSRENVELMKLAQTPPKPITAMRMMQHTNPMLSIDSVLDGLGMDPGRHGDWRKFLQKALSENNEMVMRRDMMSKMIGERMQPELRRALFQRAMNYYKGRFQKSLVEVVTIDELHKACFTEEEIKERFLASSFAREKPGMSKNELDSRIENLCARKGMSRKSFDEKYLLTKAEAKGGNYHRRVTNKSGKHRYYATPEDYARSKDAHVDGGEAADKYIGNNVRSQVEKAGDEGCDVQNFKSLVKKYGSKKVGDALKGACTNGGMTHKDGKFYLKKSELFTIPEE